MRLAGTYLGRREDPFRMIATPRNEIAELAWFTSADRGRVTEVERPPFGELRGRGELG